MSMNDEDLIRELKKGDTRVLRYVYVHLEMIISFVNKNSGTTEDAHDLFQEAVIVFHRNAIKEEFKLTAAISTYLYSICRRMWFNNLKKKKKESNGLSSFEGYDSIEFFEFELPQSADMELTDRIDKALNELGEPCKSLLQLYYYKRLSQEQIKEELDYNSSQVVRQQKYRCLKRIREKLI